MPRYRKNARHKKYQRMSEERDLFLRLVRLLLLTGRSFTQARKIARRLLPGR